MTFKRFVTTALIATILVGIALSALMAWLWRDRPVLESVDWPQPVATADPDDVTLTWLGVTTMLFDDGETQILIDGFVSRPTVFDIVLGREVANDIPKINEVLLEYQMRQLSAIIVVHSHYDHAMDIGAIANRSSASILGSESTANIARGAGVPDDQILVVSPGREYLFGDFSVRMIEVPHAPIGWRGATPYAGRIAVPLEMPAPVSNWRVGENYSIVISHPQGTTLVHGSAGFSEGALDDVRADVVLLSVAQLKNLGREYSERYWQTLVTATGASSVFPVHFDDFTQPFGVVALPPKIIDDFPTTARWLEDFRQTWDQDINLYLPEFGRELAIYSIEPPPSS